MFVTLIDTSFLSLRDTYKWDPNFVNSGLIKFAPVLPTSGGNFREEKGRKLVRTISAESIYRCMLLFLDHILYCRAHFVRDALRASRVVLAIIATLQISHSIHHYWRSSLSFSSMATVHVLFGSLCVYVYFRCFRKGCLMHVAYPKLFRGNGYAFRGDNSDKLFCLPSEKGSILKGRNSLPVGKADRKAQTLSPLAEMAKTSRPSCSKLTMSLVNVSLKFWSLNMAYTLIFCWKNVQKLLTFFQQKYLWIRYCT